VQVWPPHLHRHERNTVKFQHKTVIVITAGAATLALGAAARFFVVGPLLAAPIAAVVLLVGRALVVNAVHSGHAFGAYPGASQQDAIVRWLTIAGLWRAVLLVVLAWLPELALLLVLVLLAMTWVEYMLVDLLKRGIATVKAAPVEDRALVAGELVRAPATRVQQLAQQRFGTVLGSAGYPYLHITGTQRLGPDQQLYKVQVPSRVLAEQQAAEAAIAAGLSPGKQRFLPFSEASAESIAISLGEKLGRPFPRDGVIVQQTPNAGEYDVIVMTRNVLASILVYEDDLTRPRRATDPADLGRYVEGTQWLVPLGHVEIIAQSGAGKTNLLLQLVAHYNACGHVPDGVLDLTGFEDLGPDDQVVVWIGGRRKQYETWGAYLLKYMNTQHEIPIDLLVNGQHDTVNMLLAGMLAVQERQAIPHDERGALPHIAIVIDEYQDVAVDDSVTVPWQGVDWTASMLDAAISRGGKSARVHLVRLMHDAVKTAAGTRGAQIKRAFNVTIMLRSNDRADAGRATGAWRAKGPEHEGEALVTTKGSVARRAKAKYMQEINKPTAPQTGGITVPEVGWARRNMVSRLDVRTANACGDWYAARHRYMTVEFRDYLRGVAPAAEASTSTGHPSATSRADRVRAEARASIDAALGRTSTTTAVAPVVVAPVAVAAPVAKRATLRDRTLAALREAEGAEVGLDQLVQQLGLDEGGKRSLQNLLTALVKSETIERPEGTTGVYRLAAARVLT